MMHEAEGEGGDEAAAADVGDVEPGAEATLVFDADDGGEPSAESVLGDDGSEEAEGVKDLEEKEVIEVEQTEEEEDGGEDAGGDGVEAAREADVEHGADEEGPEGWRHGGCGDDSDAGFGDVLLGEQFGERDGDEATIHAEGGVGEAHEPYRCSAAAKVQTNLLRWRTDAFWLIRRAR